MEHWRLTQWCTHAVTKILYPPDRRAVYDELRQHLDDRCEALLAQGMSKDEAAIKTIEAMGDPSELADQLAAVHRPFWAYASIVTKWLMVIAIVLSLIGLFGAKYTVISTDLDNRMDYYYEKSTSPDRVRVLYLEPNCSDSSDGYTFTVTRTAIQQDTHMRADGTLGTISDLYMEVEVTRPNPWAQDCYAMETFWGIDNLGRKYVHTSRTYYTPDIRYLGCSMSAENSYVLYYDLHIILVDEPLENLTWVELHYNRAGRDVVLHIDLTGGYGK